MTAFPPSGSAYSALNAPYPPSDTTPYQTQSALGYPQLPPQYPPTQGYPSKDVDQHANYSDSSQEGKYKPTAPPLESVQKAPGYENTTFSATILPPPAFIQPQQPVEREEIKNFAGISDDDVRDAAVQFVSEKCCYGKDTVREMEIKGITMTSAFHYTLETFTEKRETAWCYDPYGGEPLDTSLNGVPPGPWEIAQIPSEQFKDSVQKSEVPHTASAMSCHVCIGLGRERCNKCNGLCQVKCTWCNGSSKTCSHCNGNGKSRCTKCHGTGQMKCRTCAGKGSLKCYVKLTTTWTNHKDDFIFEQTDLPDELIRGVTGHVAFEETYPRVWPVNHFPQYNINEASRNLVAKHSDAYTTERILQQRHRVRIVPVAQVQYSWKENHGFFFVYGFENKVHFPNYPQSCCCGCNIL